jgi:hypothetical protein
MPSIAAGARRQHRATRKDTMDTAEQHRGEDATREPRRRRLLSSPVRAYKRNRDAYKRLMGVAGAALVAGLVVATAAPAGADSVKTVTCKVELHNVAAADAPVGEEFGTVRCPTVFGDGVVHDFFTIKPTSKTTGTVNGRFKEFFDAGTINGTFKLTFNVSSTGVVTSSGTAKIAGGTGAFKGADGSVKVACKSTGETQSTCIEKRTVKFG